MAKKKSNKVANKKKKKNKVKIVFAYIIVYTFLAAILAAIGFGIYFFCTTDKLDVKDVKVKGNEYYKNEEILEVAKVPKNKNMFLINKSKIEKKIEKNFAYIEKVRIKWGKDNTLKINIVERKAVYAINNSETNEYIRVDKYGIMLEKINVENITKDEMPIFGLSFDYEVIFGEKVPDTEFTKIQRYIKIKESFEKAETNTVITSVNFRKSKVILTLDYKIEVITEISDDLEYKMNFLKEILKEISGKSGIIDLTQDNPTFVEKIG